MRFDEVEWRRKPNESTTIYYFNVYGDELETEYRSYFRGHHANDLVTASQQFIFASWPSDIRDFYNDPKRRYLARGLGLRRKIVVDISVGNLYNALKYFDPQFVVIHYREEFDAEVKSAAMYFGWPVFGIISSNLDTHSIGSNPFRDLEVFHQFQNFIKDVVELVALKVPKGLLGMIVQNSGKFGYQRIDESFRCEYHNTTHPNEALAFVAGYVGDLSKIPVTHSDQNVIYDQICRGANRLIDYRASAKVKYDIKSDVMNDIILFFPHYSFELFNSDEVFQKWILAWHANENKRIMGLDPEVLKKFNITKETISERKLDTNELSNIYNLAFIQDTFDFKVVKDALPEDKWHDPNDTEVGRKYFNILKAEVAASTVGASFLSTNYAAPVLRFSPSLRRTFQSLNDFVDLFRDSNFYRYHQGYGGSFEVIPPRYESQNKLASYFRKFQDDAAREVPKGFQEIIDRSFGIKAYADFPFEWIRSEVLPLAFLKEFSRIPHTPGHESLRFIKRDSPIINLVKSDVRSIKVMSYFDPGDNQRGYFCETLEKNINSILGKRKHDVAIRQIEVLSVEQFVSELIEPQGNIIIIDMHGSVGDNAVGSLYIGGKSYSSIEIDEALNKAKKAKGFGTLPAIAILSSCNTFSPMSGSYSIASTLLANGVVTVLGTFLPIGAVRSAELVSTLICKTFMHLNYDSNVITTWRNLVRGDLNMLSTYDWIRACQQYLKVPIKDPNHIIKAMEHRYGDKFQIEKRLIKDFSEIFSVSESVIKECIMETPYIDFMSYVQLGFPEKILLSGSDDSVRSEIDAFDLSTYVSVSM